MAEISLSARAGAGDEVLSDELAPNDCVILIFNLRSMGLLDDVRDALVIDRRCLDHDDRAMWSHELVGKLLNGIMKRQRRAWRE